MAGHSLGGALASLIALTNDLPAFAYEAPGDLMYAQRIGLLPDLPPSDDPNATPDWTEFLSTLPIYHFGNTLDPIFLGECTGPSSSCYWFDYALEMKCHVGYECEHGISALDLKSHADRFIQASMTTPMRTKRLPSLRACLLLLLIRPVPIRLGPILTMSAY